MTFVKENMLFNFFVFFSGQKESSMGVRTFAPSVALNCSKAEILRWFLIQNGFAYLT